MDVERRDEATGGMAVGPVGTAIVLAIFVPLVLLIVFSCLTTLVAMLHGDTRIHSPGASALLHSASAPWWRRWQHGAFRYFLPFEAVLVPLAGVAGWLKARNSRPAEAAPDTSRNGLA